MTHRFVVPSAFVQLLRAEHTTAIRFQFKPGLWSACQLWALFTRVTPKLIAPHNVFGNVHSEFPHACPTKFLYHPFSGTRVVAQRRQSSKSTVASNHRHF